MTVRPFLVNGEWRTGDGTFEVRSPYDDAVVAEIGVPTAEDVEEAVATPPETTSRAAWGSRSIRTPS
jgi:acyl-CoA reductase-like NAD-dependent aldehyde dehydrogenase